MVAAVQTQTIFSLRSRTTGRYAVMTGNLDAEPGVLIFESRDHAENFHRNVIGSRSISRQKRKAAIKEWQVVPVPGLIPDNRYCLASPNENGVGHDLTLFNL